MENVALDQISSEDFRMNIEEFQNLAKSKRTNHWTQLLDSGGKDGLNSGFSSNIKTKPILLSKNLLLFEITMEHNFPWYLACIYGHPRLYQRQDTWNFISQHFKSLFHSLILLCGDFNQVLLNSEKHPTLTNTILGSLHLLNLLYEFGIVDLPHTGCKFSLSGIRRGISIFEKMNKAMSSFEWSTMFPSSSCQGLPIQRSDHGPILISTKNNNHAISRPFKLESFLTLLPDFPHLIVDS
ncbi:hypothetical protein LIER_36901 [Lithospermum erythrorhizon]|uniref:Endonuclease/exonuclease/phosphatase domain-containing protein n=1 Tax=Lithospermum erythrorhizon TaxID=34254 RepID=A0AAV3PDI1_LITER